MVNYPLIGDGTPLQYSCLENPTDGGAWWAAVHLGHEESDTIELLHFHFSLSYIGEGKGNPLQCSCLENPRDGGAWWTAIHGVAQSRTRLKQRSSSSSMLYSFLLLFFFLICQNMLYILGILGLFFFLPRSLSVLVYTGRDHTRVSVNSKR